MFMISRRRIIVYEAKKFIDKHIFLVVKNTVLLWLLVKLMLV